MINWAKKVPQVLIARLYNQSSLGIYDDELIDQVGYALYARCESIISVTNGYEKHCLSCPDCGANIPLAEDVFNCSCNFKATLREFRLSYKNKQLYAANALPVFINFRNGFKKARTYGEKLICIDVLIHSFHIKNSFANKEKSQYFKEIDFSDGNIEINRPTGANLIEGSLSDVILFLDKLSSIEGISGGKEEWRKIARKANGGKVLD